MTNRFFLIAAFVALAAVAVVGWARKPAHDDAVAFTTNAPGSFNTEGTFAPTPGAEPCATPPAYETPPAFADRGGVRVVRAQPASAGRPLVEQPAAPQRQPVRKHRSTARSAAIVAGSAGTGAAIGGIAAGGKGAALGAISGGAAGFIYDRLTANRR
jgi:hypothetical protein